LRREIRVQLGRGRLAAPGHCGGGIVRGLARRLSVDRESEDDIEGMQRERERERVSE
jgi:hypothetical protein